MKATLAHVLDTTILGLTVQDLLAISPDLRKEAIEYSCTYCMPVSVLNVTARTHPLNPVLVKYSMLLHEILVKLNDTHEDFTLLDEGLEVVVIREDMWLQCKVSINLNCYMHMQTMNRGTQLMPGYIEMLEIEVTGIKT